MVKKGDTLIEVLLAVGIFSMIAISVVAVMSGGTSEAQLALETTLTREEIDAQAEALRYIHDSYINDKNSENDNLPTIALWRKIKENAITLGSNEEKNKQIVEYAPTECKNIAEDTTDLGRHAFVLNTRQLKLNNAVAYIPARINNSPNETVPFRRADTYPRLRFKEDNQSLISESTDTLNSELNYVGDFPNSTVLQQVDGMYVIAVADQNTTKIIDINGKEVEKNDPAFYDFYIRTCWYGTDDDTPSTISTVIRLHNPDSATTAQTASYCVEGGSCSNSRKWPPDGPAIEPVEQEWPRGWTTGWTFDGWCIGTAHGEKLPGRQGVIDGSCDGTMVQPGNSFSTDKLDQSFGVTPMYSHTKYTIYYNSNGSSWTRDPQICYQDENSNCIVQADGIKRSGYEFMGWCTGDVNTENGSCSGITYQKGDIVPIPSGFNSNRLLNLKAIWRESNRIITIRADWTSATDYDSYMQLTNPSTQSYTSASWATTNINVTYHNQTYSLVTGLGDGRGNINGRYYEEFVINTLGGKNYYYSIRKYPSGDVGSDITIKVTIKNPETGASESYTYYSKNRNCNANYWNVFGYRDGEMINRNTCSASMQYDYN